MAILDELKALPTDRRTLRSFGWMVGGVFCLIAALLFWRDVSWAVVPLWIGAPLVLLGLVVPRVLRPVYLAWMFLGLVLSTVMTRVVLTLFFFLVLTPVGLVFRLIGRDALTRRPDRDAESYWIEKTYPIADRTRFQKFF